jgi:hypothetical protein
MVGNCRFGALSRENENFSNNPAQADHATAGNHAKFRGGFLARGWELDECSPKSG